MILTESEIQQVLEQVKAAFPNLNNWQYNNEKNQEYFGFSVWREFILNPEEAISSRFFITVNTYEKEWQGCLTIGLPANIWSRFKY